MNEHWYVLPLMGLGAGIIVLLLMIGGNLEKSRIYNKCLDTNGTMLHNDAVKHCREMLK